jgi:hypothetical protein
MYSRAFGVTGNDFNPDIRVSMVYIQVDYTSGGSGDTTAPSTVSNLAVDTPTSTSLRVTWTAPGDDGTVGTAPSYHNDSRENPAVISWVKGKVRMD